jgi:predicted metal-dependent peptidase
MANIDPVERSWDEGLLDAQRRLVAEIKDDDPRFKKISSEDLDRLDAIFWRYRKQMPWHAAAFAGVKRVPTYNPAVPTAGVGWQNAQLVMAINLDWFFGLPLVSQIFTLAHEVEHIVRAHVKTMKEYPDLAQPLNFTMDSLINVALVNEYNFNWANLPKDIVSQKRFSEAVRPIHRHKFETMSPSEFMHDFTGEKLLDYLPENENGESAAEQAISALYGEFGEFFDDGSVPDELKDAIIESVIDEADVSAGIGSMPGYLKPYADRLRDKTNRDWRKIVRGVGFSTRIRISQSWAKINKRFPFLRPGKYVFTRPPVLLVVDRSGSVGAAETAEFIKEMNGIVDWVDMDVIFVDARWDPTNPKTYVRGVTDMKKIWQTFVDIGGGTYFNDVYQWLIDGEGRGRYETVMLLTDGWLGDSPRIPATPLARHHVAILTPQHDDAFEAQAKEQGWQVCVIDDSQRKGRRR